MSAWHDAATSSGGDAATDAGDEGASSFTLREMAPSDLPVVMDLERALFPDDAWSDAMFLAELAAMPGSRYFVVAEEAGAVAGYAGLAATGTDCDVQTIGVRRSRWGHGIGAAMLAHLIDEGRRRGCTTVFLEVRADNPRARRLYKRFGFDEIGVRRGYYQPAGVDAIVMCLRLDDPARAAAGGGGRDG